MTEERQNVLIGAAIGIALSALLAVIALPTVVGLVERRVNDTFRSRSLREGLYATDGLPRLERLEKRVDKLEQGAE